MTHIDCDRARELMDLCLDGELREHDAAAFHAHLSGCDDCVREFAELGRVLHELKQQPVPATAHGYWDDVWRVVHRRVEHSTAPKHPVWRLRPALAALASLVGIAIAVSYGLHTSPLATELPPAETTSQHALVMMHHPYTEPGLVFFAMSEGTLASYSEQNHGKN